MNKKTLSIQTPPSPQPAYFKTSADALEQINKLYFEAVNFLADKLTSVDADQAPTERFRAFYPEVRIKTSSFAQIDNLFSDDHTTRFVCKIPDRATGIID